LLRKVVRRVIRWLCHLGCELDMLKQVCSYGDDGAWGDAVKEGIAFGVSIFRVL
jgi:hypothetical protein